MIPQQLIGNTYHKRRGGPGSAFRYGVDYVLIEPGLLEKGPTLFSRNRFNLAALHDRDHGGERGAGTSVDWVRAVLTRHDVTDRDTMRIRLLAQPRILGHVFNPVSFWLIERPEGGLRAVIAEVNNTFGQRHSYLCQNEDGRDILPADTIEAEKVFHVSPFQPVEGTYAFSFDLSGDMVRIRIDYRHGDGGLLATLDGDLRPLTSWGLLSAMFRRPVGSIRVLTLIYGHAVRLRLKGALYRNCPAPPDAEIT